MNETPTEVVKYPCAKCGKYFEPFMHTTDGYALMVCPEHGQYKTSVKVSVNFRKFCKRLGAAPNRSPTYYTSSEEKIRRYLKNRGFIEGLTFFHNSRIGPFINGNKHKVYYWCDFCVPDKRLILEASPSIWHTRWNREGADERKKKFLQELGWNLINLDEKDLSQLNKKRTEGKKLGRNPNVKPYHRTSNCKRLDEIFE